MADKKSEIYYMCHTCNNLRVDGTAEMMKHLKEVHEIDIEKQPFEKKMVCHLDGEDYYQSTYEWTGNGVSFSSSEWHEREEDDMMRYI